MVFTLGLLTASLIALLALPIVSGRARRSERVSLERRLPLSLGEVAAERDQIRAAHAVAIRQVEQRAEAADARAAAAMAEAGRRSTALVIAEEGRRAAETTVGELRADLSRMTGRAEVAEAIVAAQGRQLETLAAAGIAAAERIATLTRAGADAEARAREAEATAGAQAIALHDIEARAERGREHLAATTARLAAAEILVEEQRTTLAGLHDQRAEAELAEGRVAAELASVDPADEPAGLRAAVARLRTEQDTMRKSIAAATGERDRLRLRVDELLLRIEDLQEDAEARAAALSVPPAREPGAADAAALRLAIAALAADLVRYAAEQPAADTP